MRNRRVCIAALSLVLSTSIGRADVPERNTTAPVPSQSASADRGLAVVNTIPGFLAFWTAAESKDEPTQVQMFRQMVIQEHPELFTESIVDLGQKQGAEEENRQIASSLRQVRPLIPAIRVLNDRLQADLKPMYMVLPSCFLTTILRHPCTSPFRSASLMGPPVTSADIRPCCSGLT